MSTQSGTVILVLRGEGDGHGEDEAGPGEEKERQGEDVEEAGDD